MVSPEHPASRVYRLVLIVSALYQGLDPLGQAIRSGLLPAAGAALVAGWTLGRLVPKPWGHLPCQPSLNSSMLRTFLILSWIPIHHLQAPVPLQLLYAAGMISLLLRGRNENLKRRIQDALQALRGRFARPGMQAHS